MKRHLNASLIHGAVGGIIAGLVVALCFLFIDVAFGRPFHTPAALAGALTDHPGVAASPRLIGAYTVVHFGVFAALGMLAVWALRELDLAPGLLLGVAFGIVVQEAVFYAGLLLGGTPPSEIVPWQRVVAANVLSGMALMVYLHRALESDEPIGVGALRRYPLISRGVVTGLVGAAVVAVWFFAFDVVSGVPFRTASSLGAAFLVGATSAADVSLNLGTVAAYTVVHVIVFVIAGIIFVAVAEGIERAPSMLLLAILAAIVVEALAFTTVALSAQWVMGLLGIGSIAIANILAVSCMGWYVWHTHPVLQHRLRDEAVSVLV